MKNFFRIEMIGMPGSGKTFLQKKFLKSLKLKSFKIYSNDFTILKKFSKIHFFLLFFFYHPIFTLKTFFLIKLSKRPFFEKKRHMYFFLNEASLFMYFNSLKKNLVIINSEGFLYRSCFYFDNNNSLISLKNYIKDIPYIDLIILIESSKNKNVIRANRRIDGYNYSEYDIKNYAKKNNLINKICFFYKKHNKLKLLKIKNFKNNYSQQIIKNIFKIIKS
jgi:hypothetical protein